MADNETTTTPPVATGPVAAAATSPVTPAPPAEHTLPTVDPKPLLNVLDGLVSNEPAPQADQQQGTDKPNTQGDPRKPVSDVSGCP